MLKDLRKKTSSESLFLPVSKAALVVLLSLFFVLELAAQSRTVGGKVTSADDRSVLPGVNILVKGTSTGTISGPDGIYTINVTSADVLVFSYVGYQTTEVVVGERTVIDFALAPDLTTLEEIVVTGYGVTKKKDLTGAVSVIDPKEMTKVATNDVAQMMQGRVPGVTVSSDGQPGASPKIRVRGISTFGTGGTDSEPLYVVDGLPLANTLQSQGDGAQPGAQISAIRDLNPNDIESIQVLKDAAAGAIYGVRAANGVVIITTKRGKLNQGLKVDFSMYAGIQNVAKKIPVTQREDYQMINRETFVNGGQNTSPPIPPGNFQTSPSYITNIDTDWQKEGFKQGSIQNYNVALSGGGAATSYYTSLDYFKNAGTFVGNGPDYERYSIRANVDTKKGKFRFGEKLYASRSAETSQLRLSGTPGANPTFVNDMIWGVPTIPLKDPTKEGGFGGSSAIENALSMNAIGLNSLVQAGRVINRAIVGTYGEYDILKELTYRINLQYDYQLETDDLFVPMYDLGFFFVNGNAYFDKTNTTRTSGLIENTLAYKKIVNKHNINLLAGATFQEFYQDRVSARTSGLQKPYIPTLSNGTGTKSVSEVIDKYALASFLGRIDYNYDDRYFITANVRSDASSKFSQANRNAVFPSVAVAWKVHRDVTLPEFIKELKIRAGAGQVGNQAIPNYGFSAVLNSNITYAFNDTRVFGTAAIQIVDPNLKWELRTTRSVGMDVVLGGGFDFTVEYYSNKAENIIVSVPLPASTGANPASILTNGGAMQNTGIEFSMNYRKQMGDFFLEVSPNFYTLNNEVLALGATGLNITDQNERTVVGGSMARHYGWVTEGIFQTSSEVTSHAFQSSGTGPGDLMFKDMNGDGKIDDSDRTFIGNSIPNFYYGLNITGEFKNFDFTIFGSGNSGAVATNNLYRAMMSSQSSGNTNYHMDILNRWTPTNPNTDVPRMMYLDPNNNGRPSDRAGWLQSTAYFRLATVSFGYSLPREILDKWHMTKLRVYVTGQNLATFTNYKGFNPDFQSISQLSPGFDFGTYPRPVTYMLGIQASF